MNSDAAFRVNIDPDEDDYDDGVAGRGTIG